MVRLAAKDLEAILELTLAVRGCERLEGFCEQVVPGIRRLVACDSVAYNDIDLEQGSVVAVWDPPEAHIGHEQRFLTVAHQHPLVHRQQAGDLRARTLSEFLTAREFHRLELYQDFYRQLEIEDQLAFGLSEKALVAIALNRSKPSFSDRDRQVLELLRPHLNAAYLHVAERERALATIAALQLELERHHAAMIALDAHGRIAHLPALAARMLSSYLPGDPPIGSRLPAILAAFAQASPDDRQLSITGDRGQLRITHHRITDTPAWQALILTEARHQTPDRDSLKRLGLTHRQAEILQLLARGLTNQEIAAELYISPATVRKHLEHTYRKLAVDTRSQAIAKALQ